MTSFIYLKMAPVGKKIVSFPFFPLVPASPLTALSLATQRISAFKRRKHGRCLGVSVLRHVRPKGSTTCKLEYLLSLVLWMWAFSYVLVTSIKNESVLTLQGKLTLNIFLKNSMIRSSLKEEARDIMKTAKATKDVIEYLEKNRELGDTRWRERLARRGNGLHLVISRAERYRESR